MVITILYFCVLRCLKYVLIRFFNSPLLSFSVTRTLYYILPLRNISSGSSSYNVKYIPKTSLSLTTLTASAVLHQPFSYIICSKSLNFYYFPISNDTRQYIQLHFIHCSRKYSWPILPQKSLLDVFSRVKPNYFFVQMSGTLNNFFDKSTSDYVSVRSAVDMRRRSPIRSPVTAWIFVLCARCVCFISRDLCDGLITSLEESFQICLCQTLCGLGTSTNSHTSHQFGCSTTESNIKFTYRHWNCSRGLLPAPRQCDSFSREGPFMGHIWK
jgi:hypothetical protein